MIQSSSDLGLPSAIFGVNEAPGIIFGSRRSGLESALPCRLSSQFSDFGSASEILVVPPPLVDGIFGMYWFGPGVCFALY